MGWEGIGFWSVSAFGVAGVIEYVKGFFKTAPAWVWRLVLPFACGVVAFVAGGTPNQIGLNAVMILAVSQLCHELIIKTIKDRIGGNQNGG